MIQAWVLATRPKTLTAAVVPVMVATALAARIEAVEWLLVVSALLVAFSIQIGTNLVNDALDFQKGADTQDRLGPRRVSQMEWLSPTQVLFGAFCFFGFALLAGIPLMLVGGIPISLLLALSVLLGYLYTGGPYPLAYVGLGDLFVLLFFGLVSTTVVFYLLTGQWALQPFVAGAQIGLLATAMIAINNLRDSKEDAISGKNTLAVRFGATFSRWEITFCVLVPFLIHFSWYTWLTLPMGLYLLKGIWTTEPSKRYNDFLAMSALLHLTFGLVLTLEIQTT